MNFGGSFRHSIGEGAGVTISLEGAMFRLTHGETGAVLDIPTASVKYAVPIVEEPGPKAKKS